MTVSIGARAGYVVVMTTTPNEPAGEPDESSTDTRAPEPEETAPEYIDDSQLPEDLRPTDDNPLAVNEDE